MFVIIFVCKLYQGLFIPSLNMRASVNLNMRASVNFSIAAHVGIILVHDTIVKDCIVIRELFVTTELPNDELSSIHT